MKTEIQLLNKLSEVLGLIPKAFEVESILQEWKKSGDTEKAFHELSNHLEVKYLADLEVGEEGVEGEVAQDDDWHVYWLRVGEDFSFAVRNLKSFKKFTFWEDGRQMYGIRVNEVLDGAAMQNSANTEVKFYSEKQRNDEWDRIHKRLKVFTFIRFL